MSPKLTPEQIAALPDEAFAIPERREYPVDDKARAIDSLSRVSDKGTQEEKRRVAMAVNRKHPDIRGKLKAIADAD